MRISVRRSLRNYVDAIDAYIRVGGYQSDLARAFGVNKSHFSRSLKAARENKSAEQLPLPFSLGDLSRPMPAPSSETAAQTTQTIPARPALDAGELRNLGFTDADTGAAQRPAILGRTHH